ncbi:MAG: transglutaminase domain-containing protein [Myxococcota bacterium]
MLPALLLIACDAAAPPDETLTLRYQVTVSNTTARVLTRGQLWLNAPAAQAVGQRVVSIELEQPHRLLTDPHGNQILFLEFEQVPRHFETRLDIEVRLGPPDEAALQLASEYLATEPGIEVAAAEIRERARELAGPSQAATVERVLDWIRALEVKAPSEPRGPPAEGTPSSDAAGRGALHLLSTRTGREEDRARLAVALLRAGEIPSRVVLGFVEDGDARLTADELEFWVEYELDGSWRRGTISEEAHAADARYVAMRIDGDPARISSSGGLELLHEGLGLRAELVN